MKNLKTIALAAVIALGSLTASAQNTNKKVDATKSKVTWKGYKVTGSHEGTIELSDGTLVFNGNKLVGGTFTVNMTTVNTTDMTGEYKDKLDGHLKADDFFGVAKYPTSKLEFKKIAALGKNSYSVTADLTIKGKTAPVKFDISVYGNKATATVKIDRTVYDIKYGSGNFFEGLGDKTIYDEFDLVVDLQF
jgi:polyisoprenoid-binding protein YceI